MSSALTRSRVAIAATLITVAFAGAAAGCGGSAGTGSRAAASAHRNAAAAWHQVVLCARAHGMPGLPDPQINASGKATYEGECCSGHSPKLTTAT